MKAAGLFIAFAIFSLGCSHSPKQNNKNIVKKTDRKIKRLQSNLNKQVKLVKELREENQRLQMQVFGGAVNANTRTTQTNSPESTLEENRLFSSFLSAHNGRRFREANRAFQMLEKTFPRSNLFVEAIYLRGKYSIQQKAYNQALKNMNRIINDYPKYAKVRSALLAKAIIYRRLNLTKPSISVLNDLISRYPKSTEAEKAKSHLSLLQSKGE